MAGRPSGKRILDVWMNGELVGKWALAKRAGHGFAYEASWLASPDRRPISLSMPPTNGTAGIHSARVCARLSRNILMDACFTVKSH